MVAVSVGVPDPIPSSQRRWASRPPWFLVAPAFAVGVLMLAPLAYLVIRASEAGGDIWPLVFRERTARIAWNTLVLGAGVACGAVAIAVPLAWLTTRTDLPLRRFWQTAGALPLVISSYAGALAIIGALGPRGLMQQALEPLGVDRLPSIYGYPGAWLTLTLFTYPYVFLAVRGALLGLDQSLEEAARGLGYGPWQTFFRLTLPQLRPAIGAGGLLAALYAISDFSVVTLLRFDAFTRSIYTQYRSAFDRTFAAVLALMLIGFALALLIGEGRVRRQAAYFRVGSGVIDLKDFNTKQIVKNPLLVSEHGGAFVTPNSEYILEADQYPTPLGWEYAPLSEFKEKYRGLVVLWKFNREAGRIVPEESFGIETPPYFHDLADAGKAVSDGWAFWNSFNTEMAVGGVLEGNPPMEIGASQRDMDYLHVINYRKAAEVVAAGKAEQIKGFNVIRMDVAVAEGLMYLVPEPKSPHGVDVTPNGEYLVVSGKLDPHVTVYSFAKIQAAIDAGATQFDDYGVPILDFQTCLEAQVELGLGPLHTQYDDKGFAYTSLFLDSAIARWSLGGSYNADGWKLIEKVPVHYNVGHIAGAGGDTAQPDGKYLVALNKWSVDRFPPVGPLLPQNLQLLDIREGKTMRPIFDMPLGMGEPHYAQIIRTDKIQAMDAYPQEDDRVGWDAIANDYHPHGTQAGQERVERDGTTVNVFGTVWRSRVTPDVLEVNQGETVIWHITNIEMAKDATHGFVLGGQDISLSLEPGETETITFVADTPGVYPYYCTEFCSALHLEMAGYFLVKPTA